MEKLFPIGGVLVVLVSPLVGGGAGKLGWPFMVAYLTQSAVAFVGVFLIYVGLRSLFERRGSRRASSSYSYEDLQ